MTSAIHSYTHAEDLTKMLFPLEFTDCLTDSPDFRENLHAHEKELERTSQAIKQLIKEVKDLVNGAKALSRAQRSLAHTLATFQFECIGNSQTDDEIVIAASLKEFSRLINSIEDERDRMLERTKIQFIEPLERFRKEHIGGAKEEKKKFEKQTTKFIQSQERHLNLSTKKQEAVLQEADAILEMEQRHFCQASLEYVFRLQEVHERKKFEFVETVLGFMYGWLTFYHQGHEVAKDFKPYMTDLQVRLQKTRDNFNTTHNEAETLMKKMLEKPCDPGSLNKMYTRQGYLYLMEKKAFGTTWTKHYCQYSKENQSFLLKPYSQTSGKFAAPETIRLKSCVRRMSDSIEKRFCFDITAEDRPGVVYTFQATSEEDRKLWMDAMDGKEPTYAQPKTSKPEETCLDEAGFSFVRMCIGELERRGLEDQGLYRLVGVASKVNKLLAMGLDRRKAEKLNLEDRLEWENKTITSAIKTYFRNLPEPLMSFRYHTAFIAAAKQEQRVHRVNDVHTLVYRLPEVHFKMLELLMSHLNNVSSKAEKNLMTVSNLGVCFGPTLLRPEEETMAAIMDIKFCNVVVEILIENCEKIFKTQPEPSVLPIEKSASHVTGPPAYYPPPPPAVTSLPSARNSVSQLNQPTLHTVVTYYDGPRQTAQIAQNSHPGNNGGSLYGLDQAAGSRSANIQSGTTTVKSIKGYGVVGPAPFAGSPTMAELWSGNKPSCKVPAKHTKTSSNPVLDRPGSTDSSSESVSSRSSLRDPVASIPTHSSSNSSSPQAGRKPLHSLPPGQRLTHNNGVGSLYTSNGDPDSLSLTGSTKNTCYRRVRTLYACMADNESELSFEPNQILTHVRPSKEPGWLECVLDGKNGLVPENYVEFLP